MKSNKEIITKLIKKQGMVLGCWDKEMEKISKNELKRVLDKIGYGSTDVHIKIRRKDYVVEVSEVDNECDFKLLSRATYEDLYGKIYEEDWYI